MNLCSNVVIVDRLRSYFDSNLSQILIILEEGLNFWHILAIMGTKIIIVENRQILKMCAERSQIFEMFGAIERSQFFCTSGENPRGTCLIEDFVKKNGFF